MSIRLTSFSPQLCIHVELAVKCEQCCQKIAPCSESKERHTD